MIVGYIVCASAATLRGGDRIVEVNKQPYASWTSASIDNCKPGCHLQQGVCVCSVYETNARGPCNRDLEEKENKNIFENIQNSIASGMGGSPSSCQPGCHLQQGVCVCNVYETNSNAGKFTQCEGKTSWGTASLTCTPGQCCHVDSSGPSCLPC